MAAGTIRVDYDIYVEMQYRLKYLEKRVASFESGDAYRKLKTGNRRIRHYYEKRIAFLEKELAAAERRSSRAVSMWFEVFDEVQKECGRKIRAAQKQLGETQELLKKETVRCEKLRGEVRSRTHEVVEERSAKIREEEKNLSLMARLGENSGNSSIPSSRDSFRGKVTNNRERTGRAPGAQPGHEGHGRRQPDHVDNSIEIETPEEITRNPDYYKVDGKQIHKKVVDIEVKLIVTDYYTDLYRNRKTRARYHAPFPDGLSLEVSYGESVRAMVFFMKNHLNVPEEKIIEFFSEVTDGQLQLSRGMVNAINREFSARSKAEQDGIFAELAGASVLHTDMTNVRMNGQLKNVVLCSNKHSCMYSYRDHKGDAGIRGTAAEVNTNLLVHDHDRTMYHYGRLHQECNEHHLRYLKGAMENEPHLTWHGQMRSLLQEMNRTREEQNRKLRDDQIEDFEKRYDSILDLADKEYEDNPPTDYYRKGFNLSRELREYRESTLRFLHDPDVDFTNNEAERCCRKIKRHMAVSGTFRGNTGRSAEEYCAAMSVLQTWRMSGEGILKKAKEVFGRTMPDPAAE